MRIKKTEIIKKISKTDTIKLLILFFTLITLLFLIISPKTYSADTLEVKNLKGIELNNNTTIIQKINTKKDYSHVGFLASSNNNYIDNGILNVSIIYNGKVKKSVKLFANEICDDNYYYKYYYIKYNFKKNRNYTIKITAQKLSDPVFIGKTNYKNNGFSLQKNDNLQKGNVALSFMYQKNDMFYIWYYLMIVSLLIMFLIMIKMKGVNHERD